MSKVVLVTGATSGIGRATAHEFAKRGARLVLGSRGEEAGHALLNELGDVPAVFQRTDVASESDTRALVELALQRFGRLDVAVNNAALEARGLHRSFRRSDLHARLRRQREGNVLRDEGADRGDAPRRRRLDREPELDGR